jgi:RNA polymerase sigma-70 factor, ECF subfamily
VSDPTGIAWYVPSDEDARFTRLYERHYRSIRAFCRRRVPGDLVDDAVAETFLAAWRQLPDVPEDDDALLWLYRVAYRVVGHQWRGSARRRRLEDRLRSVPTRPAPSADAAVTEADDCRLVLEAANHLAGTDAEVLRLMAWEQLSMADIAAVLDISANAVKQRLHRARRNLAREYRRLEERPTRPSHPAKGRAS